MKVAVLSTHKCNPYNSERYIIKALIQMGHEVVNDIDFRMGDPAEFSSDLDFVLAWKCPLREWGIKNYEVLSKLKCPKVLWYPDIWAMEHTKLDILDLAPYYDILYTANLRDVKRYKELDAWKFKRVEFLPPGVDAEVFSPVGITALDLVDVPRIYDIGFVGSLYNERKDLVDELKKYLCVVSLDQISHDLMAKVYRFSKLCFNKGLLNQGIQSRILEVMSCGRCLLTNALPEEERIFKHGQDLVYYEDKKELLSYVSYYLAHPKEREWIGAQARETILKGHTWEHRLEKIFANLGAGNA